MSSALAAIALATVAPRVGSAQETLCTVVNYGDVEQVVENGERVILLHDPFVAVCPDGEELRANSGRYNRDGIRDLYLYGDVFFQDSAQTLTSNEATYNPDTARLWARGDVVYSDRAEGTTLRGPELEYLRATEIRPLAQMVAIQRPTLTMPPDEGSESAEPMELTSDRIEMIGEEELSAFGDVVITRADLRATSGEARYNSATEELSLRVNAVLVSQEFELVGDSVDARLVEGRIDFLHARVGASLQGEDLRVTGDDLQLDFDDDLLQRVVARVWPESETRAIALSATFQLQADSLDAIFVDQRIEEVHAIGNALGESVDTTAAVPRAEAAGEVVQADSDASTDAASVDVPGIEAGADILARDWIQGDTIIGYFAAVDPDSAGVPTDAAGAAGGPDDGLEAPGGENDPSAALAVDDPGSPDPDQAEAFVDDIGGSDDGDPGESVVLRRLVAIGGAQSLYRMRPQDQQSPMGAQNVNFLVGQRIELEVAEGELQVATVEGLQYGVYLEALDAAVEGTDAENETGPEGVVEPLDEPLAPDPGGA